MSIKQTKTQSLKPNPKLFENTRVGGNSFEPLKKKGKLLKDVDYFELLGRKCIKLDEANTNSKLPTDYGKYDKATVAVAKEIVKGIDAGISKDELNRYIQNCIDYEA